MTHLAITLSKLASTGEPQEVFSGDKRPDGRVTLIADENPSMPNRSAAVEIDRSEAIRLIDHLRQQFDISAHELREIQV